jgi:hypothetical protein
MTTPSSLTTFVHEVEDPLEHIEVAILALETTPGGRARHDWIPRCATATSSGAIGDPAIGAMVTALNAMVESLRSVASDVTGAADNVATGSAQMR